MSVMIGIICAGLAGWAISTHSYGCALFDALISVFWFTVASLDLAFDALLAKIELRAVPMPKNFNPFKDDDKNAYRTRSRTTTITR